MIRGNLNARKMPLMCKMERNSRKRFSLHRSAERCTAGSKRTTGKTEGGKGWKIVFVTPEFYVVSWEINVGQV